MKEMRRAVASYPGLGLDLVHSVLPVGLITLFVVAAPRNRAHIEQTTME